jgi:twinkle protein
MSNVTTIEMRARQLDEARKIRVVKSQEIDTEKYLKANDVTHKVHDASVWLEELQHDLISPPEKDTSTTMPWAKTHGGFRFRPGEVTVYAGGNGGGKSLVTGQVAMGLIKQKQRVCIASFEMKPKRTLYRMLRQFAGENIEFPRYTDKATYIGRLLGRFTDFSGSGLWFYDQQGTTSSHQVIAMARYCAVELGIQHVFIDSLMKCVTGEDDYNAQKGFVDELTALARDHNIHIHLIHHIRKLGNEEMMPSKSDIKGSGAIADQVDNVLLMWRNKKKEHDIQNGQTPDHKKPDALLMCEKQRNGDAEEWYSLWFNRESQQFVDEPGGVPMSFDSRGAF